MRVPGAWVGVDVLTTRLRREARIARDGADSRLSRSDIMVHSAAGERVARVLTRCASMLGFDVEGERLWADMVADLFDGPYDDRTADDAKMALRAHWVKAPDGMPVGLVLWLAPGPVLPRPVYNSWILDLDAVTTSSAGDDLAMLGTDRQAGEPRPIRDLLRFANADDVPRFLALYWDAATGTKGLAAEAIWSIHPPGAPGWVHFWSAAHPGIGPTERSVYGMSLQLVRRPEPVVATLRHIVQFTRHTLILVDAERRITLHTEGVLREELRDSNIVELLEDLQIARIVSGSQTSVEATVTINDRRYEATAWPLPSVQSKPVQPAAIVLRPVEDGAVS
ncbi:hypothetical protein [Nocardia brasiliensis]|uniref:hypothetical protein n=1 Tax=Nocardia brasiliensis TaxID=37326 RepID=UPI0004A77AF8|nr:hypothetical protein [Nocardia brasiliensis]MBF6125481.1 hypothetical protein [Nocardia brasiliensis]MBF6548974.1 hypothetical protein [Nocardia brasiliensis]